MKLIRQDAKLPLGITLPLMLAIACSSNGSQDQGTQPSDQGSALDLGTRSPDSGPADLGSSDSGADQGVADLGPDDLGAPDSGPVDMGPADLGEPDLGPPDMGMQGPLTLTSPALANGGVIPDRHACAGADLQPELNWQGVPPGTQSFALVMIDDTIDFVHWVAYNIPPTTTSLAEATSDMGQLPKGTVEANAFCQRYCGPCPPNMHQYTFRLYALDVPSVNFPFSGFIQDANIQTAFGASTLESATLTGTFTP